MNNMVKRDNPLTEKQEKLLYYFYSSRGAIAPKEAAERAGYAPGSVYETIRSLRKEIMELTELMLVESAPKAANTLFTIMESEETIPQASVRNDVAKTILDRVGLGKKDRVEVKGEINTNLFFIPSKKPLEAEKVIDGSYTQE